MLELANFALEVDCEEPVGGGDGGGGGNQGQFNLGTMKWEESSIAHDGTALLDVNVSETPTTNNSAATADLRVGYTVDGNGNVTSTITPDNGNISLAIPAGTGSTTSTTITFTVDFQGTSDPTQDLMLTGNANLSNATFADNNKAKTSQALTLKH